MQNTQKSGITDELSPRAQFPHSHTSSERDLSSEQERLVIPCMLKSPIGFADQGGPTSSKHLHHRHRRFCFRNMTAVNVPRRHSRQFANGDTVNRRGVISILTNVVSGEMRNVDPGRHTRH